MVWALKEHRPPNRSKVALGKHMTSSSCNQALYEGGRRPTLTRPEIMGAWVIGYDVAVVMLGGVVYGFERLLGPWGCKAQGAGLLTKLQFILSSGFIRL